MVIFWLVVTINKVNQVLAQKSAYLSLVQSKSLIKLRLCRYQLGNTVEPFQNKENFTYLAQAYLENLFFLKRLTILKQLLMKFQLEMDLAAAQINKVKYIAEETATQDSSAQEIQSQEHVLELSVLFQENNVLKCIVAIIMLLHQETQLFLILPKL